MLGENLNSVIRKLFLPALQAVGSKIGGGIVLNAVQFYAH